MAIMFVSMSEFNLFKCSHFLNSFELLGNRKKTYTYLYGYCVFTISCKTKTIVANVNNKCTVTIYFRITTALCHLTAVLGLLLCGVGVSLRHTRAVRRS